MFCYLRILSTFFSSTLNGSGSRTRTYDPAVNSRLLYQLSYTGINGRGGRIRTCDPLVPNQMRCQTALHPEIMLLVIIWIITYIDIGKQYYAGDY